MDHRAGHKDTAFTWAMGHLILQRMADRETIKAITADPRMPAYCTVFQWVKVVPEFGDHYRAVRATLARSRLEERDARRGPKRPSGRKSTYTPELADEVCERVRWGKSLSEVSAEPDMPSFRAIYRWLKDRPDFRATFVEACDWRAGWLQFQIECAAEAATPFTLPEAKAEVARLEGRIGRLTPKTYRVAQR
jgi:hypothetical protein